MPIVTYHLPDGTATDVDVQVGQTIMDGSTRNNLPGIVAECGGSCSCATCHVHVDATSNGLFAEPAEEETELLEFLDGACDRSRLSCQLVVPDTDERIEIHVVDSR